MNRTKANSRLILSKAGIAQCQCCGKLQPNGPQICKYCDTEIDYRFYTGDVIPTAKMKEVPFYLSKEITLHKSA